MSETTMPTPAIHSIPADEPVKPFTPSAWPMYNGPSVFSLPVDGLTQCYWQAELTKQLRNKTVDRASLEIELSTSTQFLGSELAETMRRMNRLHRRRERGTLFGEFSRFGRVAQMVESDSNWAETPCFPVEGASQRTQLAYKSELTDRAWNAWCLQDRLGDVAFGYRDEHTEDDGREPASENELREGLSMSTARFDLLGRGQSGFKNAIEHVARIAVGGRVLDSGSRIVETTLLDVLSQLRTIALLLALLLAPRYRNVACIMFLGGAIPGIKADPGPLEISSGVVAGAINIWTANVVPTQDRIFNYFYHIMILIMIMLVLLYAYKSIIRREGVKRRMAFVLLAIGGGVALAAWFSGQEFEKCLAFFLVLSGFFMSFMFDHGTAMWSEARKALRNGRDFTIDQAAILHVRFRGWIVRKLGPQPELRGVDPPV